MQDFEEYIRQGEPSQQEKAYNWQTAIGLQAVDGLQPSAYLIDTARKHIEGAVGFAQSLLAHQPIRSMENPTECGR